MQDWARLGGLFAFAVVALVGSLLWAFNYPPQDAEWTCRVQTEAYQPNPDRMRMFSCRRSEPAEVKNSVDQRDQKSQKDADEGIKITDKLLTLFNGLLVAVGVAQAAYLYGTLRATRDAAVAARVAAEHVPRVERAYVFGDVLFEEDRDALGVAYSGIRICISNYGKTPGDVERIAFDFCDTLPTVPDYSGDLTIDDRLVPGAENRPTRITRALRNLPGSIIYGRVYYRDIFGQSHSSGFVRRITSSQIIAVDNAPRAFIEYD